MDGHRIAETVLAPGFATINLAYIALLIGAFLGSIKWVRTLLVVAALCFVAYGSIHHITSMVVWNLVIGGLNLQRLVAQLWSETQVSLTAEQEGLRRQLFAELAPAEFKRLWALGQEVLCADQLLLEAGRTPDRLYLLLRGTVQIRRGDRVLESLAPGAVIGQLEPAPFSVPSVDWHAAGAVWLRCWDVDDLAQTPLHRRALGSLVGGGALPAGSVA